MTIAPSCEKTTATKPICSGSQRAANSNPTVQSRAGEPEHIGTYKVKTLVFVTGERFPLLILPASGLPSYDATAFELQMLRGRGLASSTMEQALRSIAILLRFLDSSNIDLNERISEGRILTLGEVEGLARLCHQPCKTMHHYLPGASAGSNKVVHISGPSRQSNAELAGVDKQTTSIRLTYIAQFISWKATSHLQLLAFNHPARSALQSAILTIEKAILARRPRLRGWTAKIDRKGLDTAVLANILLVTRPDQPANPWKSIHARIRNYLIILWLLIKGVRRGELAGIRIAHFNSPMTRVQIVRRADDPKDDRLHQPNAKTRYRDFELSDRISRLTREYILQVRSRIKRAKKHDFLFVADRTGRALSLSAINKIFAHLRENVPDLPKDLSPHWFRHTWNDNFSELIDELNRQGAGIDETTEKGIRNWLMGWSPESEAAVGYTKRHTRTKADRLSIAMQKKIEESNETTEP